jgi:hypothetical protein
MRRKRNSNSTAQIVQHDHRRAPTDGSRISGKLQHGPRVMLRHHQVTLKIPQSVPIRERELRAIEILLGVELQDLLSNDAKER